MPPSPVPHLLGSKAVPSEMEIRLITVSVSRMRDEARLLNEVILRFNSLMQKLQCGQQTLQAHVVTHATVHSNALSRRLLGSKSWASFFQMIRPTGSSMQNIDAPATKSRGKQDDTDQLIEWLNSESTSFDDPCSHCGFVYQLTDINSLSPGNLNLPCIPPERRHSGMLQGAIMAGQKEISGLHEDISRVETFLQQLKNEFQVLQKCVAEHEAVLSPARRLLPELWSEIFLLCTQQPLEGIFLYDVPNIYSRTTGPLLFTQVCQTWRDIALSSPRLWTTVGVVVEAVPGASQVALVGHWLAHSGDCPLTVYIAEYSFMSRRRHPPTDWSNQGAVNALIAQSRRWQKAYLRIPPAAETWRSFSSIRGRLPILQKLSLHARELKANSWPEDLRIDVFRAAPQLNELNLDYGNAGSVELPYHQLANFDIRGQSMYFFADILESMPCLRVSSLYIHTSHIDRDSWYCALYLSVLSYWGRLESGLSLLGQLSLPFLRRLELHCNFFTQWDHHLFLAFLDHSMCLLRYISIRSESISADQVSQIFEHVPSVQELNVDISAPGVTGQVLSQLADATLLPQLATFSVYLLERYIPDFLIRFIHMRTWKACPKRVSCLRYMAVYLADVHEPLLDDTIAEQLDEWCRGGLWLKIYSTNGLLGSEIKICYDSLGRKGVVSH